MGVDIRWFNHDKREYLDTGARWGLTGHPSSCLLYVLMRGRWNGDRVKAHSDHDEGNEFFDLAYEYLNVTPGTFEELARVGCCCSTVVMTAPEGWTYADGKPKGSGGQRY